MALRNSFSRKLQEILSDDVWLIAEYGYDESQNLVFETNFGLASGVMGSRGVHEEGFVQNTLPACYVHGVFDRSEAFQREFCNTPDWAKLKMYYERMPISPGYGTVEEYLRVLDMKQGLVCKRYIHTAAAGQKTQVESVKLLTRTSPRCAVLKVWLTPLNYSGLLEFENIIDGTVTNFIDFPRFRVKHLVIDKVDSLGNTGAYIQSHTRDLGLPVGTACRVRVLGPRGEDALRSRNWRPYGEVACEFFDAEATMGETISIEKYSAVCTGRDFADVKTAATSELDAIMEPGFSRTLESHAAEYARMWRAADLQIDGDEELQKALRFNIFHLMSTASPADNRVGIGAKLMHGEEYGGHSFWDTELFILPFFNYVFPKLARNLVDYRYHLLDKARENAVQNGYLGAKYPWESADTGDEECPQWTIEPDGTCSRCYVADYEHHVTAAVAFGTVNYFTITGDEDYFYKEGLELLAETARFWNSRLEYREKSGLYEINRVTGPDEWHEPVNNNAYTNYLAQWNIRTAVDLLRRCQREKPAIYQALTEKINLTSEETAAWAKKADSILLRGESGLMEQFDGYFKLADVPVNEWDKNNMPLLPEALKAVPKEKRSILKQADVVMLMFLLEYQFDLETQRVNFEYYEKRTLHRSSLSPGVHCIVGLRTGEGGRAYEYLERSAYVDLRNNQGNTREGIHAASAGITWQSVTLGYCGMSVAPDGMLSFAPRLPERWTSVRYSICRGIARLCITVTGSDVHIIQYGGDFPMPYRVNGLERLPKLLSKAKE